MGRDLLDPAIFMQYLVAVILPPCVSTRQQSLKLIRRTAKNWGRIVLNQLCRQLFPLIWQRKNRNKIFHHGQYHHVSSFRNLYSDRFLHHAREIAITGRSYRLIDHAAIAGKADKTKKTKSKSNENSTAALVVKVKFVTVVQEAEVSS
jgi:hypothetical protein